jgi:hypothetical protein
VTYYVQFMYINASQSQEHHRQPVLNVRHRGSITDLPSDILLRGRIGVEFPSNLPIVEWTCGLKTGTAMGSEEVTFSFNEYITSSRVLSGHEGSCSHGQSKGCHQTGTGWISSASEDSGISRRQFCQRGLGYVIDASNSLAPLFLFTVSCGNPSSFVKKSACFGSWVEKTQFVSIYKGRYQVIAGFT